MRLAIRVLENVFDKAKLKASVYKSSVDGEVTVVVSVLGVDGVAGTERAMDGPASSANRTLDGVEWFNCMGFLRLSSTSLKRFGIGWQLLCKLLRFPFN